MRPARGRLRRTAVLALWAGLAVPGWSDITLSPQQMGALAVEAIRQGAPDEARMLAEALLGRDPQDQGAHVIRARAMRDQGLYDQARQAARQAWALADTDTERYAAARVMAQALSSDGKRTRAQFWLRRAAHHAPTPRHADRARRDFRHVQRQNPWQTHLSFTLAPNSNINNGSARESSRLNHVLSDLLFGAPVEYALTGAARALSALEYGAALRSRYRMAQTERRAHDLKFSLSYRSFVLSDSARATAPGVSGGDFAFGSASIGYGFRSLSADHRREFTLDAELGQSWYAGARYASFLRLGAAQSMKITPRRQLSFAVDAEKQMGQATVDVDTLAAALRLSERLESGRTVFGGLSARQTFSGSAQAEYREVEARGGFDLGETVMGAEVTLGLGVALRDYDVSPHSPTGRQDRRVFADATATFRGIDYYGFNPALTVSASRTDSNIGLYDTRRFGVGLGIRSAF